MSIAKGRIEWIPLNGLMVDPALQRVEIKSRSGKFEREFAPAKVGIMTVSQRANGDRHLVDGQHRWIGGRRAGYGDLKVKCEVFDGLTRQEEADLFLSRNDTRVPSAIDKYRLGLMAEDPTVLAVDRILRGHHLKVSSQQGNGNIGCVSTLLALERRDLLSDVLQFTGDAWDNSEVAVDNNMVSGVAMVLDTYNGEMDRPAFVKKLQKESPAKYIANAKLLKQAREISTPKAVAVLLIDQYNKGRGESGRLATL